MSKSTVRSLSATLPTARSAKLQELDQLYQTAPIGLCLLDRNFRYVRINEWLAAINGRPVHEHIGRSLHDVIPQIAPFVLPYYRKVFESGMPILDVEVRGSTPADPGAKKCWLVSYYPLKGPDGEVASVSSAVQDISGRKLAERALRSNEERLRRLLETTKAIPWEWDVADWQFTYVGPQAEQLLGYPIADWYQKGFWVRHIHPEDRERSVELCREVSRQCRNLEFEYRMITARGETVWLHDMVSVETMRTEPGPQGRLRGFLIDITERKRTEEALRRSEERYRDLYDHAPDMFFSMDLKTRRIRRCNLTAARETGYSREELIGKPIFEMYDPDCLDHARSLFGNFLQTGEVRDAELVARRKDGSRFDVSLSVVAIRDETGEIARTLAVWRDITDHKRAVREIEESTNAYQSLASRLLSFQEKERQGLARELRDDLTQRLAVLALEIGTLEHQDNWVPGLLRQQLHRISEKVVNISSDIHRMSRQLHPSIIDDLGLVQAVRSECATVSERERITVELEHRDVPEVLPKPLALCLYRVVQESLRNVSRHSRSQSAEVRLIGRAGEIRLEIRDRGIGFDLDRVGTGEGLGLVSMRERAKVNGGTFHVDSRPGAGTLIEVNLPLKGQIE